MSRLEKELKWAKTTRGLRKRIREERRPGEVTGAIVGILTEVLPNEEHQKLFDTIFLMILNHFIRQSERSYKHPLQKEGLPK